MNRKLINGLLLLTVATGGVGTFTSCKDDNNVDPIDNKQTLTKLVDLINEELEGKADAEDLKVVKDKLNALIGAGLLTEKNQQFLLDQIRNNEEFAKAIKTYVDDLVVSMITNVEIQEVYNPAFGTINLPLGIQSTLLANYYYQSDHPVVFPKVADTNIVYGDKYAQAAADAFMANNAPKKSYTLGTEVQPIDRLGEIYVTINPAQIPAEVIDGLNISLETSNGKTIFGELKAVKDDDHLINFGYTRANVNGFYRIEVKASAEQVPTINITLDDQLKATAKDFLKDPSKSDLANLAEAIYKQFNNRVPALALAVSSEVRREFNYVTTPWNGTPGGIVLPTVPDDYSETDNNPANNPDASAGESTEVSENPILRSVYSRYAIGAVTYHPLSYSFDPEGYVPDRRLPQIGHIQEYVSKALDKVNFQLNLKEWNVEDYKIDFSTVKFEVKPSSIEIDLSSVKDSQGKPLEGKLVLGYDGGIASLPGDNSTALNGFVQQIVAAVNGQGDDPGFKGEIEAQVNTMLEKMVNDINTELKGINTQITDKIQSVKDEITNELNGRLGDGINRLIDLYNKLAQKVNTILDDPNAYMQIYAAYRDGNGDLHHFSTAENDPSIFTQGTGDAITMFLTSYNGELLAPAYKKYVAVVKDLTDGSSVDAINANADCLNTALEGRQQKAYLPVGGTNGLKAGHKYQVVYTALDYRGNVSARSFYVVVK